MQVVVVIVAYRGDNVVHVAKEVGDRALVVVALVAISEPHPRPCLQLLIDGTYHSVEDNEYYGSQQLITFL